MISSMAFSKAFRILALSLSLVFLMGNSGCDPKQQNSDLYRSCDPGHIEDVAKDASEPKKDAPAAPPLDLNPATLKKTLFDGNTSLLVAINRVHKAKDQVNIARGNLLPSINLGALVLSASNPAFMVTQVEALVPFLIPSKWFNYFQAKDLLKAENAALKLMRLNVYASAYSLFFTVQNDQRLLGMLEDDLRELENIEEIVHAQAQVGIVPEEEYLRVHGQVEMARVSVSKVRDLLTQEVAALRHALGFGPSQVLNLQPSEIDAPEWEGKDVEQILPLALEKSVEKAQMDLLKKAADHETWSKIFGFVTGASVRASSGDGLDGGDFAFSNLSKGVNFNLGFALVPAIELSQKNALDIQLRQREIPLELGETLDVSLEHLVEGKNRYLSAVSAEQSLEQVYEKEFRQYQVGQATLKDVLDAKRQARQASLETLRADSTLRLLRVTLHRMSLTNQFSDIRGCAAFE